MEISFSRLHKYETCGAAYHYYYVRGLRPEQVSANLLFGKVLHKAKTDYIKAHALGETDDPAAMFEREWARALGQTIVEFSATQSPEAFHDTGVALAREFPAFWERSGLTALIGPGGQPMVEQKLTVEIVPGVDLRGYIDLVALTADGEMAVIDLKTAMTPAPEATLLIGEQLTDYQILADANRQRLGIESIARVGFIELLKRQVSKTGRGKGPEIVGPSLAPPRTETLVTERRAKIDHLVTQIRKGAFFRNPGMAYNTPCSMCEFRNLCLHGSMEGLAKPAEAKAQLSAV